LYSWHYDSPAIRDSKKIQTKHEAAQAGLQAQLLEIFRAAPSERKRIAQGASDAVVDWLSEICNLRSEIKRSMEEFRF
jgi:hypothetical protein